MRHVTHRDNDTSHYTLAASYPPYEGQFFLEEYRRENGTYDNGEGSHWRLAEAIIPGRIKMNDELRPTTMMAATKA
jgi:hypothetical protein